MRIQHQNVILNEECQCFVEEYDAYYGDGMPIVMDFWQTGKIAMIQNVKL